MKKTVAALINEGWEAVKAQQLDAAAHAFMEATESDPSAVDAWNGVGAVHFERGELKESLLAYRKARTAALALYGGEFPDRLPWVDEHKPALRAIHGMGLNYFRLGKGEEAAEMFEALLSLNPEDNQGAKFLLADIRKGKHLWKKDE
jgi:tetratricopeptide (TPR) repeat protein